MIFTQKFKSILKYSLGAGLVALFISAGTTAGILGALSAGLSIGLGCFVAFFAYEILKLHLLFPSRVKDFTDRSPLNGEKAATYNKALHKIYGCTVGGMLFFFGMTEALFKKQNDKRIGYYMRLFMVGLVTSLMLAFLLGPFLMFKEGTVFLAGFLIPVLLAKVALPLYIHCKGVATPAVDVVIVDPEDERFEEERVATLMEQTQRNPLFFEIAGEHAQSITIERIAKEGCPRCFFSETIGQVSNHGEQEPIEPQLEIIEEDETRQKKLTA